MKNTSISTKTNATETTHTLIIASLMAALTCVGTMIIKVPTPTNGYIHPGDGFVQPWAQDGFVLLSGLLLGPIWGGLAAGIGSALSDLIGGYFIYVPATFIIKALTAFVGYFVFVFMKKVISSKTNPAPVIISGITGEAVMVVGYFLFEIYMLATVNGSSVQAGFVAATAGLIPNIIQGVFGVIISTVLYPLLTKLSR